MHMIDIVFVRYYLDENEVKTKLDYLINSFQGNINRVLVVNIADDKINVKTSEVFTIVDFSSDMMDIAAYCEGLRFLSESCSNYFFLINDTLFSKHPYHYLIERFKSFHWVSEIKIPAIIGVVDETKDIISNEQSLLSGKYISTFAFMVNLEARNIFIETYMSINDKKSDAVFNAFLDLHLVQQKTPYSWKHSGCEAIIAKKRSCVLFERYLSRSIKDNDGILIDINNTIFSKIIYRILDKLKK